MNYEEKYKEALERARMWKDKSGMPADKQGILDDIFPELKESEDERIRKALICGMYALKEQHKTCFASIPIDNAIAWLEKQYQVKESTISQYEEDDRIRKTLIDYFNICHGDYYGELKRKDILAWLEKQSESIEINPSEFDLRLNRLLKQFESLPKEELISSLSFYLNVVQNDSTYKEEKQCEQKPADKIEPKFKVGDWIISKYMHLVMKILNNDNGSYKTVETDGTERNDSYDFIERNFKLWTIQDAKDGDVLISKYDKPFIYNGNLDSFHIGSYCGITTEGMFNIAAEKCYWTGNVNIRPATKEQCDTLIKAMADAGYEWDADKKELKKINSYCQEHCKGYQETGRCFADGECEAKKKAETDWSEEDECYMSECIGAIATKDGWSFEEKRKTKHWLKSLKERIKK